MKFYSTVFLLSLLTVSCSQSHQSDKVLLTEAQNYNNSRSYGKTIDLLENSGSLTTSQQKELIYAYAGSAGLEAATLKNQIDEVGKILSNEELSPTGKVTEILKVLPKQNKEKLDRLNSAISLFVKLQESNHLLDADSKFQLGVLYFYRSVYTINLMFEFSDEGIAQTLEEKVSKNEFDNLLDFFNANIGNALGDLKKSYDQLVTSYPKIKKLAAQIDKNANYFLSDQVFKKALSQKFTKMTDLYKAYIKDIGKNFQVYFNDLDRLGDAIGLEQSAQDIFHEFRDNPEKIKRILSRIELTVDMFIDSSKDRRADEIKQFDAIFTEEIKEELKERIAISWREKNTDSISEWLSTNDGKVQKIKDFIKLILNDAKNSELEHVIDNEAKVLVEMIDRKALKKFGKDLEAFNNQSEEISIKLERTNQQTTDIYTPAINKSVEEIKKTTDKKLQEYHEDTRNDERIEFDDLDRDEMNESIDKAKKVIEE